MTTDPAMTGGTRIISVSVDTATAERQTKVGVTDDGFTVYCDESERLGGDDSAPSPMRYMALALGF